MPTLPLLSMTNTCWLVEVAIWKRLSDELLLSIDSLYLGVDVPMPVLPSMSRSPPMWVLFWTFSSVVEAVPATVKSLAIYWFPDVVALPSTFK